MEDAEIYCIMKWREKKLENLFCWLSASEAVGELNSELKWNRQRGEIENNYCLYQ